MISAKVQKRKRLIFYFFGNKGFIGIVVVINNYSGDFFILLQLGIKCLVFRSLFINRQGFTIVFFAFLGWLCVMGYIYAILTK